MDPKCSRSVDFMKVWGDRGGVACFRQPGEALEALKHGTSITNLSERLSKTSKAVGRLDLLHSGTLPCLVE